LADLKAVMRFETYFLQKTVVVTGAAGFIGSHLSQRLLSVGATVIGIDNFLTGRESNLAAIKDHPQFHFIQADVIEEPSSYLPPHQAIDVVLHFASPASPPRYQAHPIETYQVNAWATHRLLQYLHRHHSSARFLFASTSEVYGDPAQHPQTESYWGNVNPNGIRSCYDESKRLGETICGVHERDLEMDVRIVRIFNTYGPHMDPRDGRIIPHLLSQALLQKPFIIHGDGQQTRSYCYIDDLVEGILRLAAGDNLSGVTVNLGNDHEFTILETLEVVRELTGSQQQIQFKPLPQDDPLRRRPDLSLAKKLLDWEPKVPFKTGLAQTLEYFTSILR
jgi:dTDP-glucose 4,6-dehydratase